MQSTDESIAGFKCDSCGKTFPAGDGEECYNCGSEYVTPISDMGAAVGCELCGSTDLIEEHHTSYFPEKTMSLCASCHNRVHKSDGFYDELKPDISRPDNYESALRDWKARHRPDKFECVSCEGEFVAADVYSVEEGDGELPSKGDRVRCYSCTGRNDSLMS